MKLSITLNLDAPQRRALEKYFDNGLLDREQAEEWLYLNARQLIETLVAIDRRDALVEKAGLEQSASSITLSPAQRWLDASTGISRSQRDDQ